MVLPTYLPYFFYVPFLVNSTCKVPFKKKIPCPFSVLDKTLGYEPTTVPITLHSPPPQESSYLDDDIVNTNIQSDQFSCSDHRGLFCEVPM